jgi:hypothetical protein
MANRRRCSSTADEEVPASYFSRAANAVVAHTLMEAQTA